MALVITRLSGGTTPADGSDPRTYPAIWNATATALEAVATDLDTLELSSLDGVTLSSPVDGNLLTYNGSAWVNAVPAVPAVPAGSVLQVVSATLTATFSASLTTAATAEITGLTATITPVATSSKILVLASVTVDGYFGGSVRLLRGATAIGIADTSGSRSRDTSQGSTSTDTFFPATIPVQFLDSPATVSATTYSFQIRNGGSTTQTVYVNRPNDMSSDIARRSNSVSTITLMEVAG